MGLSAIGGTDYMVAGRTAGEIMTRDVLTARRDMPIEEVAKLLAYHNVSGSRLPGDRSGPDLDIRIDSPAGVRP